MGICGSGEVVVVGLIGGWGEQRFEEINKMITEAINNSRPLPSGRVPPYYTTEQLGTTQHRTALTYYI